MKLKNITVRIFDSNDIQIIIDTIKKNSKFIEFYSDLSEAKESQLLNCMKSYKPKYLFIDSDEGLITGYELRDDKSVLYNNYKEFVKKYDRFKITNIQAGMVVELRDGTMRLVINLSNTEPELFLIDRNVTDLNSFIMVDSYDEYFINKFHEEFDIMKVYELSDDIVNQENLFDKNNLYSIWNREDL